MWHVRQIKLCAILTVSATAAIVSSAGTSSGKSEDLCIPRSVLADHATPEGQQYDNLVYIDAVNPDGTLRVRGSLPYENGQVYMLPVGGRVALMPKLLLSLGPDVKVKAGPKGVTFRLEEGKSSSGTPCIRFVTTDGNAEIKRRKKQ